MSSPDSSERSWEETSAVPFPSPDAHEMVKLSKVLEELRDRYAVSRSRLSGGTELSNVEWATHAMATEKERNRIDTIQEVIRQLRIGVRDLNRHMNVGVTEGWLPYFIEQTVEPNGADQYRINQVRLAFLRRVLSARPSTRLIQSLDQEATDSSSG